MKQEIKVPQAGESVTEAMISEWFVEDGSQVEVDQVILELETDKANMEMAAPAAGVLHITVPAEDMVTVGQVIGYIDTAAAAPAPAANEAPQPDAEAAASSSAPAESAEPQPLSPAVRRIVAEEKLDPATIEGSGKDGRILKGDALAAAKATPELSQPEPIAQRPDAPGASMGKAAAPAAAPAQPQASGNRNERVVNMSMMRRSIAKRLVDAQHTAAILTTFNEIDMSAVMALRSQYKAAFEKKHGVRLGFMSFFIKASIAALQAIPEINAMIDGNKIIYRDYCDIGVAVGTEKGLVVPVIRNAEQMSFAQVEKAIYDYAVKARDGKISLDDLSGGTFTLSNGGVYGSLLSTPILNPPQSGILGMHKIEKRPVAINDEVVIRPMMYVALSYDHRIVDGKGAVTFLVKVKEYMEDPARMLLEI